jgi:hypothetical protein
MVLRIGSDHPPTVPGRPGKQPHQSLPDVYATLSFRKNFPIRKPLNELRLQASRSTRNRVVIVGEARGFGNAGEGQGNLIPSLTMFLQNSLTLLELGNVTLHHERCGGMPKDPT